MNFFKSHFWYNTSQRNGIIFLIVTILIFQLIYLFVDFSNNEVLVESKEIIAYQHQIDSLKLSTNKKGDGTYDSNKIHPFNPNYLTDYTGFRIGMHISEIDRLLAYRKSGKFVNSSEEFQEITKINDSLLHIISPYFKFPDWVNKSQSNLKNRNKTEVKSLSSIIKKDLNSASIEDLKSISGVGEILAKRISSYRELLNGFSYDDQLYEVYYLNKETAKKILTQFTVIQKPDIVKININEATFKEVLHLPYIDYELTKKLFNYRNEIERLSTIDEIKKIDSFPLDKFNRITLYLSAE